MPGIPEFPVCFEERLRSCCSQVLHRSAQYKALKGLAFKGDIGALYSPKGLMQHPEVPFTWTPTWPFKAFIRPLGSYKRLQGLIWPYEAPHRTLSPP